MHPETVTSRETETASGSDVDVDIDLDALRSRLERVRADIAAAVVAAGRDPRELTLIAVTKFQPLAVVRALAALGVTDFGESRHQEARAKASAFAAGLHATADRATATPQETGAQGGVQPHAVRWHFIGQLQTNKARQVRRYADVVHSVDRASLVAALAARSGDQAGDLEFARPVLDCFLQIDLAEEPGRGGAAPADAESLAERIATADGLRLLGVMAVAPIGVEPRRAFAHLRAVAERVRRIVPTAQSISAGMSGDYAEAIAEGATHLRVGTAITGPRPTAP